MNDPPLFPIREPNTSIAALPLILDSSSSGIYAICVVGSNNAYFDVLDTRLNIVPHNTAVCNRNGLLSMPNSIHTKNGMDMTAMMDGVAIAPTLQPNSRMTCTPKNMTIHVQIPTTDEKLPINR